MERKMERATYLALVALTVLAACVFIGNVALVSSGAGAKPAENARVVRLDASRGVARAAQPEALKVFGMVDRFGPLATAIPTPTRPPTPTPAPTTPAPAVGWRLEALMPRIVKVRVKQQARAAFVRLGETYEGHRINEIDYHEGRVLVEDLKTGAETWLVRTK